MQATVRSFDPGTRSGSVFFDDGTIAGFGPGAFARSGLRLLRPGQRVAVSCGPDGAIADLTLATFPLATQEARDTRDGQPSPPGQDARPA
jgi:hypothetical protein